MNRPHKQPSEIVGQRRQRGESDLFAERLAAACKRLSPAAQRVVRFIDRNRIAVLANSAAELGASTNTSDATVVRAVQALGFEGLDDLRQTLMTSLDQRSTPADNMRRTLADVGENADRAIEVVLEIHREAIEAMQSEETRRRIAAAVAALHCCERIWAFGIGPSAPVVRYTVVMLRRTGRQADVLDTTGLALADQLLGLREGDALLVLAYTHPYREVMATFQEGRRLGLPIVLITDCMDSKLVRFADVVIPVRRGRAERVALHGATLVALEALILGLVVSDQPGALTALGRLNDLREVVLGKRTDI